MRRRKRRMRRRKSNEESGRDEDNWEVGEKEGEV